MIVRRPGPLTLNGRLAFWLAFAAVLVLPTSASHAADNTVTTANQAAAPEQIAELRELQSVDQRVADIAWRLLSRAGDLCPAQGAVSGISLHSLNQYTPAARDGARAAFGFYASYPSILSIARTSPAQQAGLLPDDAVIAVNGEDLSAASAESTSARYDQVDTAMRALEALPPGTAAKISIRRQGIPLIVELVPAKACKSRVELVPGPTVNGNANGAVAQISGGLAVWTRNDDELALVIAHEIAHNILGHQAEIKRTGITTGLFAGLGRSGKRLREMELDADRLGTWLAARAGFDYRIAPTFWERLGKQAGLAAALATTHPTPATRRQRLEAVVEEIANEQAGTSGSKTHTSQ